MTADLFDAQLAQVKATIGAAGGKPPKLDSYPRPNPKAVTAEQKVPTTVADLYKRLSANQH